MVQPSSPAVRPARRPFVPLTSTKQADLGDAGGGDDASFEQAFASLANAYIRDKAPGLLDYMVGFQLVDRDDDKAKAVGLFGFKAGSQWLYAPVFFLNGRLKGHELLLLKDQKRFVPLDEGWVDYLLAKKPASLGEGVNRNTRQLGVHYPDMFRALQSPHKYASAPLGTAVRWAPEEAEGLRAEARGVRAGLAAGATKEAAGRWPDWAVVGMAALAEADTRTAPFAPRFLHVLARGGVKAARALQATFATYPRLRLACDRFYPAEAVKAAAAAWRVRVEAAAAAPARPVLAPPVKRAAAAPAGSLLDVHAAARSAATRSRLEIHTWQAGAAAPFWLDDAEKAALLRDRVLIKDARADDEVSTAYAVPVRVAAEKAFRNPTDSGVYETLMADGTLARCLIVIAPIGPRGKVPFATVVRLDGRKNFVNVHPSYVWVAREAGSWADWWGDLPVADHLAAGDTEYLVLGADGVGTLPLRVQQSLGTDVDGGPLYTVRCDTYASKPRPGRTRALAADAADDYEPWRDGERLHLDQSRSRFKAVRGDIYCPRGARLLRLAAEAEEGEDPVGPDPGQSANPPVLLGDLLTLETGLLRKTAALRIGFDGLAHAVGPRTFPIQGADALVHLVRDHGLRKAAAEELLAAAAAAYRRGRSPLEVRIKYADAYAPNPPYLTGGGPYAPAVIDPMQGYDAVFGSAVPSQHPFESALAVPDLRPNPQNRDAYDPITPDPLASQVAQESADRGQKELFDTSMVANLLKTTDDDQMIDENLPALKEGLSRIGRLLFSYYWHGELFADRYGDDELVELEASLRNTFAALGKLTLSLEQQAIEPMPDEVGVDLAEVADQ